MYDEASHLVGEYDLNGVAMVEYVWLGDKPIAAIQSNGSVLYLVTDRLNTPRRGFWLNNPVPQWSWDPDAYGVAPAVAQAGVVMNLRFAGQVYDVASGLHYNLNRYYNPKSPDVIKSPVVRTVNSADGARYVREVDVGRAIGTDRFNGNQSTSIMTIMSDKYGNLVTSFPGVLK